MRNHGQSERLSWGDTVFLHLEREGMPLNVASVCIFEGEISFRDCVRFIESKLPLLPRYLKRVVSAPLGLGLPSWEYDPGFDVDRHIRREKLKHGTETELKALAGKLFSKVMDRNHPLWDVTLVRGLKRNRTAVIIRLHHCLADGIAGVGLMNVMLDANPAVPDLPKRRIKIEVPRPHNSWTSLTSGVVDSSSDFIQRILSAMADVLSMAERAAANGGMLVPADELSPLMPEIMAFTQRLRFNVPYTGPQKFAWAKVPLDEVKSIKRTVGASVNDVLLALVTATIRQYLEQHGDNIKGRLFRMMVPVNLRGSDSAGELGNRISLVPVTIPLDVRDPLDLLVAVHRRTEFLKHTHAAELVSLSAGLIGMFPTTLQALAGPVVSKLPITPFNMVCTNVPGPQYPLYLLGHKMLEWYPYVPVGGEMPLNCAILSYDGNMYFGFSGDVHAAPDLRVLEKLLKSSFEELRTAIANDPQPVKKNQQKKVRRTSNGHSKAAAASTQTVSLDSPVPPKFSPAGHKSAPGTARSNGHAPLAHTVSA
ncbi:MAG TPA: wax ester/triacylglycerol synthase family O-acyltransferase [Candidatus Sulfotelmatobacter sp.]|nr:wax ester/triacylglycerol synthase family O-acyltransferase [Candidatus Sulfotelmatobacter sp.]